MKFFDDWFNLPKAERPRVRDLDKDAVDGLDRFDREDFASIDKQMRAFRLARHEVEDFAEATGHELWSDNFFGLFKAYPKLKDPGRMRPTYLINHVVASEIAAMPERERLRTWTQGDIVAAAMSCTGMKHDLMTIYDRAKKRRQQEEQASGCSLPGAAAEKAMEEYEAAEDGIANMEAMIEAWKNLPDAETPEGQAQAANLDQMMAQAQADLAAMQEALTGKLEQLEADLTSVVKGALPALRTTLRKEADANERLVIAATGWGVEPGELRKMDPEQRAKLAERLTNNPKVKRLTEIMGAMERTAMEANTRKVYHSFEEVYDVGMGSDLGRVLPEELVMLTDPLLELDFMRRYCQGELLQYEMRGEEKLAKGGIIFCMDNSQSMEGDPEIWAKAVGLATLAIARAQKRSFYGIHFSSQHELKSFDFRKPEDVTLDNMLEYAEHFFCGGTNFQAPLAKALSILQEEFDAEACTRGDIVFVTDGICRVPDAFMRHFKAEQDRLSFQVYGLMIGPNRTAEPLWSLCDKQVVTITDLLTGDEVTELFRVL